ncbi:MAG TPA: serine/threonine-protein kinase [Polyangiaceae bacterium]|nr:serine/threonine-protein kinase [Polyangiaceae bacterium]
MSEVRQGDILAGKFRIERVLGQGGMGVVVAAHHLHLDERVAIKFLLPEALGNGEAVARFAREARAAVKIKSEHVARVSDVGTFDSGAPYMVMEYLEGRDLSARIRESGALPVSDAVDLVLQASEALAEAHALGIIHRDLKPSNLFLAHRADGSPCVKVLDFGISKIMNPGSSGPDFGMTRTQAVMGSPLYMSPEQMTSSRQVDARTDIWAVGCVLYEALTGRVPFEAESMPQLCAMILQQPATPPRNLRPDLPDGLQQVILRCLAKDRSQRYQNVAELANALSPWGSAAGPRSAERISRILSAAGISSRGNPEPSAPASAIAGESTQAAWGQTGAKSRSKTPLILLGAFLALAAGATVVWKITSGNKDGAAEQPSSVAQAPKAVEPKPAVPLPVEPATAPVTASAASAASAPPSATPSATTKPALKLATSPKLQVKPAVQTTQPVTKTSKPTIDPLEGRR